jgi:hypothetical protein
MGPSGSIGAPSRRGDNDRETRGGIAAGAPNAAPTQIWTDANNGDQEVAGIWRSNPDGTASAALPGSKYGPWAIDADQLWKSAYDPRVSAV